MVVLRKWRQEDLEFKASIVKIFSLKKCDAHTAFLHNLSCPQNHSPPASVSHVELLACTTIPPNFIELFSSCSLLLAPSCFTHLVFQLRT